MAGHEAAQSDDGKDQRRRLLLCLIEALYGELAGNAASRPDVSVSNSLVESANHLSESVRSLFPRKAQLAKVPVLKEGSPLGEVLAVLAIVRAILECETPGGKQEASRPHVAGPRALASTTIPGLVVGLGASLLGDPSNAEIGAVLTSAAGILFAKGVANGGEEAARDVDGAEQMDDVGADGSQPTAPKTKKRGRLRRAARAVWGASGRIATGALTSGVGALLGETLQSLV
jgi:hypothetical protein